MDAPVRALDENDHELCTLILRKLMAMANLGLTGHAIEYH